MGVTIKDVAKRAQVSPSTVSRVIAGNKRISQKTHQRVKKAMEDMGYYPNANARNLVRNSTETIGLVLSRSVVAALANPFFPEVLRGITSVTQKYGYSLLFSSSRDYLQEEEEALRMLRERRVDGLLLLASRANDSLIDELQKGEHSFVVLGRILKEEAVNWVNNDNIQAVENAVAYLTDLGHTKIGLLTGSSELIFVRDRTEGYKRGLARVGIPFDPGLVKEVEIDESAGKEGMEELLAKNPDLTAIFAIDDLLAIGAMRAARQQGLSIPEDISIVGFNDTPLAAHLDPPLTTVRIPIYEMGVKAATMLLKRLKGEEEIDTQVVLETELMIRDSCSTPKK